MLCVEASEILCGVIDVDYNNNYYYYYYYYYYYSCSKQLLKTILSSNQTRNKFNLQHTI